MEDLAAVLLLVALVVGVLWLVLPWARRGARRAVKETDRIRPPRTARAGGHEWDSRRDQIARKVKGIGGPEEARDDIIAFLDSHRGVEAYVEPRTVMHPLSVLLIDEEGEAKRFELAEDAFLRDLARTRGLPVFDATRVGYPERMRRRRTQDP